VEFEADVQVDVAKQKVKDAVDKARSELPTDLTEDPNITEVSFSDFPIMFVNVSGNYDELTLKNMQKTCRTVLKNSVK
jgi:Cation/multidrug efflux pump